MRKFELLTEKSEAGVKVKSSSVGSKSGDSSTKGVQTDFPFSLLGKWKIWRIGFLKNNFKKYLGNFDKNRGIIMEDYLNNKGQIVNYFYLTHE